MAALVLVSAGCWLAGGKGMLLAIPGLALAIAIVSFRDDLKPLSVKVRLLGHFLTAAAFVVYLGASSSELYGSSGTSRVWLGLAAFFWIISYINAFNFMDGINGIAGMQAFVTSCGLILVIGNGAGIWFSVPQLLSFIAAGAALGFLPHNFPKAKMFMGDVGSVSLGFFLAASLVLAVAEFGTRFIWPLSLLHANYILDTGVTLVRRTLRGDKIYLPHREHFYQRLVRSGASHTTVTMLQLILQLVTIALCVLLVKSSDALVKSLLAASVLGLWLGLFFLTEARYRDAIPLNPARVR